MIMAYSKAYEITRDTLYQKVAEWVANYVMDEMTSSMGGFYCAQDADIEGDEGKYYLMQPSEIYQILGEEDGRKFCECYDITDKGNFEGKSIPNLLRNEVLTPELEDQRLQVKEYRQNRYRLHVDDKILTSWNALMIAAMCQLYRTSRETVYRQAAMQAADFIEMNLSQEDVLYVSYREKRSQVQGFINDYAYYIMALLELYEATLEQAYLGRAISLCGKVIDDFWDDRDGGFYLYGENHETLIARPKETYDGAMPSGNSVMAYNLVRLSLLIPDFGWEKLLKRQMEFLSNEAKAYPCGYAMYLLALSDYLEPPETIHVTTDNLGELKKLPFYAPLSSIIHVSLEETEGKTTYYVCRNHQCLPPTNHYQIKSSE